tara:strand:+ start:788 stop:1432 length:645 start_codon:yes stop_codon:yes gene_type:complete
MSITAKELADKHKAIGHPNKGWSFSSHGVSVGEGWVPLIDTLLTTLTWISWDENDKPTIQVKQVKQKFGGLRVYYDFANGKIGGSANEACYGAVILAENLAAVTCEICGMTPAELRGRGWIRTLCDSCANEKEKEPMTIYLIEHCNLDPMENRTNNAIKWVPIGYVSTEQIALQVVAKSKTVTRRDCWAISKSHKQRRFVELACLDSLLPTSPK